MLVSLPPEWKYKLSFTKSVHLHKREWHCTMFSEVTCTSFLVQLTHLLECSSFSTERMLSISKTSSPSLRASSQSSTAITLQDSSSTTVTPSRVFIVVEIFSLSRPKTNPHRTKALDITQAQLWNICVPYVKTHTSIVVDTFCPFCCTRCGDLRLIIFPTISTSSHSSQVVIASDTLSYRHAAPIRKSKLEGILGRFRNRHMSYHWKWFSFYPQYSFIVVRHFSLSSWGSVPLPLLSD